MKKAYFQKPDAALHLTNDSFNFFQTSNLHKRDREENSGIPYKVPRLVPPEPLTDKAQESSETNQGFFLQNPKFDKVSLSLANMPKVITDNYKIALFKFFQLIFYLIDLKLKKARLTRTALTALQDNNKVLRHLLNNGKKIGLKEFYQLLSLIDPEQRERFFQQQVYPLLGGINIDRIPPVLSFNPIAGINPSLTINSALPIQDKITHFVKSYLLLYKNNCEDMVLSEPQFKKVHPDYQSFFLYFVLWKSQPVKTFEQWVKIINKNKYLYNEAITEDLEKETVLIPSLIMRVEHLPIQLRFSTKKNVVKLQVLSLINKFMFYQKNNPVKTISHPELIKGTECHFKTINNIIWENKPITNYSQFVEMILDNQHLFLAAIEISALETIETNVLNAQEVKVGNTNLKCDDDELFSSMHSFSIPEDILEHCAVKPHQLTDYQGLTFFSPNTTLPAPSLRLNLELDPVPDNTDKLFSELTSW